MSDTNDQHVINNVSPAMKNFLLSTMESPKPFHERMRERKFVDLSELDVLAPEPYEGD